MPDKAAHFSLEESSRCVILSPVSLLLLSPKQQDHDRSAIAVSLLLPLTKLVAQLQLEWEMGNATGYNDFSNNIPVKEQL